MKHMIPTLALCLLGASAATAHADEHGRVHIHCKVKGDQCEPPPAPPVPPAPPAPPVLPAPPAPPPLPPLPRLPAVPAAAQAACAAKAPGATLTYTLRKGETMDGICRSQGGKMVFELQAYNRDD